MSTNEELAPNSRTVRFSVALIAIGAIGWLSAFFVVRSLFTLFYDNGVQGICEIDGVDGCDAGITMTLLSFHALVALGYFAIPIVVGVAVLAGATLARWFWATFFALAALGLLSSLWWLTLVGSIPLGIAPLIVASAFTTTIAGALVGFGRTREGRSLAAARP